MDENIKIPDGVQICSIENDNGDVPQDLLDGLASVIGDTVKNISYEEFAKNAIKDENGTLHYSINLKLSDSKEEA